MVNIALAFRCFRSSIKSRQNGGGVVCEGGEAICVSCFIASHFARHLSAAYLITIGAGGHLSLVKEHHIFFLHSDKIWKKEEKKSN